MDCQRRGFLVAATAAGFSGVATGLTLGCFGSIAADVEKGRAKAKPAVDVSPGEDLMREHGVLKRILLIYSEAARRLHAKEDLPPQTLVDAAGIIRVFIEDYHEKLEEDFLFPRFKKANKLVELVDVLLSQHLAGRAAHGCERCGFSTAQAFKSAHDRRALAHALRQFVRMYGPHEAREDTVLFPALHSIVSASEYDALGDEFEKREQQRFGKDGFEKTVDRVASIEKLLGIYDLGPVYAARVSSRDGNPSRATGKCVHRCVGGVASLETTSKKSFTFPA